MDETNIAVLQTAKNLNNPKGFGNLQL